MSSGEGNGAGGESLAPKTVPLKFAKRKPKKTNYNAMLGGASASQPAAAPSAPSPQPVAVKPAEQQQAVGQDRQRGKAPGATSEQTNASAHGISPSAQEYTPPQRPMAVPAEFMQGQPQIASMMYPVDQNAMAVAIQQQQMLQSMLLQQQPVDMLALHQQQQAQIQKLTQELELLKMQQQQMGMGLSGPGLDKQLDNNAGQAQHHQQQHQQIQRPQQQQQNLQPRQPHQFPKSESGRHGLQGQSQRVGYQGGPSLHEVDDGSAPMQTKKPSGVWGKPPKVWTRERAASGASDEEDANYGDPDASADGFQTKSDKQGRMYRDMNTQEGREAIEKELFGSERHMTAGLDFDKYDDIPVDASGHGIPEPINTFDEANFCKALMENIQRANYTRPTPIQKHAIPMAALGRDVMACAQTGSGKTAAFLFPIINSILSGQTPTNPSMQRGGRGDFHHGHGHGRGSSRRQCTPSALVLAPTRELASQIHDEAMRFTYQTNVRCVVLYGGAEIRAQMDELNRGCAIIVATPGRLQDLIERGRVSLRFVKHLVLDEADRMLDMGFEPHIRNIVQGYDMPADVDGRQTAMFSATFPNQIQILAQDFMGDYIFVTVGRVGSTNSSIQQNLLWVEDPNKIFKLVELLNSVPGLTLVFVETKRMADILHAELFRNENIRCTSIHGDRSQREREQALWEFSTQRVTVLIATEVAARGLDIPEVTHVINFDLPSEIDSYVHRIGRTGRAGNKGVATSFVNEKNVNIAKDLVRVLEETQQEVPSWLTGLAGHTGLGKGAGGRGGKGKSFGGRDFRRETGQVQSATYNARNAQAGGGGPQQPSSGGQKKNKGNDKSSVSGSAGGNGVALGGRGRASRRGRRGGKSGGGKVQAQPEPTDAW